MSNKSLAEMTKEEFARMFMPIEPQLDDSLHRELLRRMEAGKPADPQPEALAAPPEPSAEARRLREALDIVLGRYTNGDDIHDQIKQVLAWPAAEAGKEVK